MSEFDLGRAEKIHYEEALEWLRKKPRSDQEIALKFTEIARIVMETTIKEMSSLVKETETDIINQIDTFFKH